MNAMIFLWLVVSIAIILFTILKLKLNPTISLILGSIFMGACLRSWSAGNRFRHYFRIWET